ncbi:ras-related protein Rab-42b isoform X1 [Danio rerio]|uniref:Ras-related protein Rab-42b isoform X1 n=1 Tax=Danio rerio TaxID=7955 RepID=A0AC58HGF4_DANRE
MIQPVMNPFGRLSAVASLSLPDVCWCLIWAITNLSVTSSIDTQRCARLSVHTVCGFCWWDTSVTEKSEMSVTRSYYRNSVGGLLVFDLGNRKSFENVREWYAEVCERVHPYTVLFVLVGHKSDRVKGGERAVDRTEAEKLASQLGAPYIEASAKTGHNVKEAFDLLTRRIYQGLKSGEIQLREGWDGVKSSAPTAQTLQKLQNNESAEKKSCTC